MTSFRLLSFKRSAGALVIAVLPLTGCVLVSPSDDVSIAAGGGSHHGGATGNTGGGMSGDSGVGGTHNTGDGGITAGTHPGGTGNHGGNGGSGGASVPDSGAIDGGMDGGVSTDPCDTDNGGCDPLVTCASSGGAVTCGNCPSGYDDTHGDGTACSPVDCGALTAPVNGSVDTTGGTTYNQTATYSCDNGYALSSTAARKCLSNGTWNGSTPTCIDIDECLGNPCDSDGDSSSTCVEAPTPGNGYTCTCSAGYASTAGLSPTCADFNACDGTQVCTADFPCQDLSAPSLNYICRGQFAEWVPVDSPSTFTVNDHGAEDTVTDSRNDLEWQQTVDANTYTWANATTYCANLVYATKSDWRLPTRAELESIVDFTVSNPAIGASAFPSTPLALFWSSSTYINAVSPPAWSVDFHGGATNGPGGPNSGRARCVRSDAPVSASSGVGGAPPGRYTVDGVNGTVLDTGTGLTWQQAVPSAPAATGCSGTTCSQAGATAYCSALSLNGTGWRLPTISELLTLVDPTQINPATDPTAFPSTPPEAFWSSSAHVGTAGYGWYVNFSDGYSTYNDATGGSRVRCVR